MLLFFKINCLAESFRAFKFFKRYSQANLAVAANRKTERHYMNKIQTTATGPMFMFAFPRAITIILTALIVVGVPAKQTRGQSIDFSLAPSLAKSKPEKPGRLLGPLDPVALIIGATFRIEDSKLDMTTPKSYIPPVYGTRTPVAGNNTVFNLTQSGRADYRLGMRFWSMIEGGIIFRESSTKELPADNPYSNEYQTFWGGYNYGDYAAIGQMEIKKSAIGWYAQLQTPDINLSRRISVQPFVFISMGEDEVKFRSGYHRYSSAFNPEYANASLGKIQEIPARAGLRVNYKLSKNWLLGLEGYAERDLGGFSGTTDGKLFNPRYNISNKINPGGGLELRFRF